MAHGGKRKGAGRKAGAAAKKTRIIADRAMAEGITPLEVMLEAMRNFYQADNTPMAVAMAKIAAPYMHAKLTAIAVADTDAQGFGKLLEVLEQRRQKSS